MLDLGLMADPPKKCNLQFLSSPVMGRDPKTINIIVEVHLFFSEKHVVRVCVFQRSRKDFAS